MVHIQFYLHIFMAHSTEIREKTLEYLERCKNISQVAKAYGISRSALYCWLDRKQKTGRLTVGLPRRGQGNIDRKELAAYIEQYPDAYLAEIAKQFSLQRGGCFLYFA